MRIISRLDIKGPNLIKSINLEGLRVVGNPNQYAIDYYKNGADELIFMDIVASLYNRNSLHDIIKTASKNIFIPFTVGGGIRSVEDAVKIFDSGADKISINTKAVQNPILIKDLVKKFGSQAVVLSVEAKKVSKNKWEPYIETGREKTDLDLVEWIKQATELGAGEILLTSIDKEGTCQGFDLDLIFEVSKNTKVPVIASGGFGNLEDLELAEKAGADAVAVAHTIHYKKLSLRQIRDYALSKKINARNFEQ
jgi:imidazole glycerol-phosphate synthase subunit HisF